MIIQNGRLTPIIKEGGGIDATTGYAIAPALVEGASIPCQWIPTRHDMQHRVDGEPRTLVSYEILIEQQPFNSEQVVLEDMDGNELGRFSVISVEPLDAVCEMRIVV